ncbi:hypothetical protein JHK84_027676 [Glycine max]|nr:hypothetical protein JHK86_027551 [Glycine max]KAG5151204.1 hypothetical protein JHK84_027676 [Glycine max]
MEDKEQWRVPMERLYPRVWEEGSNHKGLAKSKERSEVHSSNLIHLVTGKTASWWTIVKGKYSTMVLKRSGSNSICSYSETKNSPFYGQRRPMLQRGAKLLCVSDLLLLRRATIKELRSLLH